MKKFQILFGTLLVSATSFGQTDGWVPVTPKAGVGDCWESKDLIIDARKESENPFNRFGILHRGVWGSNNSNSQNDVDLVSQYLTLGPIDLGLSGVGPSNTRLYGFASSMNTDRMFVGLRYIDSTDCITSTPANNHTEAVIAWGQDDGGDNQGWTANDKLKFMFYNAAGTESTIMTVTPQGSVGIGTTAPTEQFHTTQGVRFAGLPSGPTPEVVGIDANGVLYRTRCCSVANREGEEKLGKMYEDQQTEISTLKAELELLKGRLNELQQTAPSMATKSAYGAIQNENVLFQNTPNPFKNETTIEYAVSVSGKATFVLVYDMNGKELHRFTAAAGKNKIVINGSQLASGMYLYSLVVDGKEVDTKRMIVTK